MATHKKIILAGGTGQIGQALCRFYKNTSHEIIVLSRTVEKQENNIRYLLWDGKTAGQWAKELEGADILINLAGKNVNCRYTEKNKKIIFDSRTNSIEALTQAAGYCKVPPKLWIQCASATIYRHAEDRPMTEENGEVGEGFSVEVCKKWEGTFWKETEQFRDMRRIILRTSLVLGKTEGVFPRLRNLTRFGLGGKQGNGTQWVSWVHEDDVSAMIDWLSEHPEVSGILNCTAPEPIQNKEFMSIIRKAYKMPIGLPSPEWLLELGAIIIGTETELILKSRWVLPDRLLKAGFQFKYPDVKSAIDQIVKS